MDDELDFSKLKEIKNVKSDSRAAKTAVSIRIDGGAIGWFREEALRLGIPYQTLMASILYRYSQNELVDKKEIENLEALALWWNKK